MYFFKILHFIFLINQKLFWLPTLNMGTKKQLKKKVEILFC